MDYRTISMKLKGEYLKVFEEVEAYTMIKNYAGEGNDDLMMNLLDMLLTAQEDGKEPEKIIGSDVKKFCEEYFSAYDKRADRLERLIIELMCYAWLGVFNCVIDLFDDNMHFVGFIPGMKTDWTIMLCCIGVAFLVSAVMDGMFRIMYHSKPLQSSKLSNIILIMSVISAVLGLVTANLCGVVLLLPFVPTLTICIVVIIFCFTYTRVRNYLKYGSVWKPKEKAEKRKPLSFDDTADEISSPYEKELFKNFSELYDKKNAKRKKKNQPALTPEEFMDFLEKENEKLKRDSRRMPAIWGIIAIITTVAMAVTGSFTGILDGFIFFAILAAAMSAIYYFIFGRFFYGKILSDRIRLLAKCRRNNKTVLDYTGQENKIDALSLGTPKDPD
ncbi:MAG: DUF1048 domain-containing protein [Bacteroidales bacterium]|nr:DUF1048 domain-containing protein [Clostridium sp.]MCM1205023.1 DUF1048 domain-containing protein [Bacteroidales bacterium]